jgi:hypothetical protein
MKKILSAAALLALVQLADSCKINEEFQAGLTPDQISSGNASSLLDGAYNAMRSPFQGATQIFAMSEVTTDERIMPTRAGDWDDNGKWRALHLHNWDANHPEIRDAFANLGGVIFAANDVLQPKFNATAQLPTGRWTSTTRYPTASPAKPWACWLGCARAAKPSTTLSAR